MGYPSPLVKTNVTMQVFPDCHNVVIATPKPSHALGMALEIPHIFVPKLDIMDNSLKTKVTSNTHLNQDWS